jgi:CDP-glucose 4,6-dehydratase
MNSLAVHRDFWRGRRVLVTGHTGFKGAWLSFWLTELGAKVAGLALAPATKPNLFELLDLQARMVGIEADINDREVLRQVLYRAQPEVVFHLAAQSLVRSSYKDPVGTIAVNVLGLTCLLDEVRRAPAVRAVVVVTSDKCYENRDWDWGYREIDALGGHDPYSASKGAAEIIAASMRRSFFAPYVAQGHPARIATVRAGNVIGGGDWSADRLVPDIVRGCLGEEGVVRLRNPQAVRAWQHVLEPVAAYMGLAQHLYGNTPGVDQPWNLGPDADAGRTVGEVARGLTAALGRGRIETLEPEDAPHETHLLRLDCSKVRSAFGWRPRFDFHQTIELTAGWYSAWKHGYEVAALTRDQIGMHSSPGKPPVAEEATGSHAVSNGGSVI